LSYNPHSVGYFWWDRVSYRGSTGYVPDIFVSTPNSGAYAASPDIPRC